MERLIPQYGEDWMEERFSWQWWRISGLPSLAPSSASPSSLENGECTNGNLYESGSGKSAVSPDLSSLGIAVSHDEAAIRLCLRLFARSHGAVALGVLCLCSCDGAEVIVCRNG